MHITFKEGKYQEIASKWFILGAIVGAALVALGTYYQPFHWLMKLIF